MSEYAAAKERYASIGVDTESALSALESVSISIHCWQGDDVGGFEGDGGSLGGGLAVTGNYPGKARTPDELRQDLAAALSLIPGRHRLNLHAMYGEFGGEVDRNEIEPQHFDGWIDWCESMGLGFDFNPTCFSHPMAESGFTLSSQDEGTRQFWIEHCQRCRVIGDYAGKKLGTNCITNVWIPDGMKDTPADRNVYRQTLEQSLDKVFADKYENNLDSVESKLFGIGSESYVVGSHEFYLGYAVSRGTMLTLDSGHYHPTESVADKISACMQFVHEMLLHVSRGVHWDSDHVVTLNDDLLAIAREVVANGYLDRVHIGLDYFDASINRVAAWVVGTRNMLRALLIALLEPTDKLRAMEGKGDYTSRLAMQEAQRSMPWGVVWDEHCSRQNVPNDLEWMTEVRRYELDVQSKRR
ncbi:MAG TPA: L-rhamnose isomerase [Fimbriimonadaceae bacterium]|nr:L-rhamnose isomerase [Fimbriimonadaceae bacterium]